LLSELYAAVSRVHAHANDDGARAALHDLMVQLSRFADVVAESGLNGLQNVQARLAERLLPFAEHDRLPAEFVAALEDWLQLNFHYLADPSDSARWTPLIDFLSRAIWGDPLTNGQAGILNRFFELNSLTRADSHLTTSESAPPLINANAAAIISETLDAIAGGELHPPEGEASFAMSFDVDDFSLVKELHPPDGEDSFATEPEAEPVAIEVAAEGSAEFAPPSLDVPSDAGELITLIRDELVASEPTLQDLLQTASIASLAGEQPSLEDYRWQVERLSSAASAVGLHGLHDVLSHVWDSTRVAEGGAVHEFSHQCEILGRWPALAMKYLERVGDLAISQALLDFTSELSCGLPLDATAAEALLNSLRNPALETAGSEKVARPTQATEACVALSVPEDINPALLDSMLHELPAQTQEFSTALQRIASGAGGIEELRVAQRIAHTLKGSANTVGIRGVAELSHHLEDILAALQEREILPPKRLARVLVDAADCLEGMSESLTGAASAPSQALEVLQEVLDWANKIDREGLVEDSADDAAHAAVIRPPVTLDSVTAQNAGPPLAEIQRTESSAAPMLRVATTHIDDLLRLSGESKIVGGQLKEGLRRVDLQLLAVHRQNQLFQQLVTNWSSLLMFAASTCRRCAAATANSTRSKWTNTASCTPSAGDSPKWRWIRASGAPPRRTNSGRSKISCSVRDGRATKCRARS